MLKLTDRIITAEKNHDFVSAQIEGKRSSGKSIYALNVAYEIRRLNGQNKHAAWHGAINEDCLFTIESIIKKLKSHTYKKRAKIVIMDDAGAHLSGMRWHIAMTEMALIKSLMDVIRTATVSLILTTPSHHSLMKFMKQYEDWVIRITKRDKWERNATCYAQTKKTPFSRTFPKRVFVDEYSCYLENKYYAMYMKKRTKYHTQLVEQLEESIKKHDDKNLKKYYNEVKKYGNTESTLAG